MSHKIYILTVTHRQPSGKMFPHPIYELQWRVEIKTLLTQLMPFPLHNWPRPIFASWGLFEGILDGMSLVQYCVWRPIPVDYSRQVQALESLELRTHSGDLITVKGQGEGLCLGR